MNHGKSPACCLKATEKRVDGAGTEKLLIFQQNHSGERKIEGIKRYAKELFTLEMISIDEPLPKILDSTEEYLPRDIRADLVVDFLKHPDLSHDLAVACSHRKIPVIASGKKLRVKGVLTPPT